MKKGKSESIVSSKLLKFLNLCYAKKFSTFAKEVGVSPASVTGWLGGTQIGSDKLVRMYALGLNINWLMDPDDTSVLNMFNETAAGQALREHHFGGARDLRPRLPQLPFVPVGVATGEHHQESTPTPHAAAKQEKHGRKRGG
jgi:hypothetical protein